jgi:hypothetical protein
VLLKGANRPTSITSSRGDVAFRARLQYPPDPFLHIA